MKNATTSRLPVVTTSFAITLAFTGACSSSPSPAGSIPDAGAPDATPEAAPTATPAPVCSAPQGAKAAAKTLVAADTAFAVDFYTPAVALAGATSNMIVSPFSVSATLTMVDTGAAGETATQIETVLHLPDSAAKLAPAYAALACEDETDGSYTGDQLSIANSIWTQQNETFKASFLSLLSNGYDAPLRQVDFAADPKSAETTINQWVSKETQGQIPALLQPGDIDTTTRIVLVDAIYFKGTWEYGFNPGATSQHPFTLSDGSQVDVPTMDSDVYVSRGKGAGLSVIELPYLGGALAMDILLPNVPDGGSPTLSSLEAGLTPDTLNAALATVTPDMEQVELLLPKFSFSTRLELAPLLGSMGMPDAFDATKANLSGMDGAMDLYITAVVHEATVEVDESGTIATAATGVVGGTKEIVRPPTVTIDRPFLFLIRDTKNGSILFMGHVQDPRPG